MSLPGCARAPFPVCSIYYLSSRSCLAAVKSPPTATQGTPRQPWPRTRQRNFLGEGHGQPPAEWTSNEILAQLLATYRDAKTYQDNAVVRLTFRQNGQPVSQDWPTSVAFERPNRIGDHCLPGDDQVRRAVNSKPRSPIPNSNKSIGNLWCVRRRGTEAGRSGSDGLLHDVLSSRLRRQPIQLELLLESSGLVSAFKADVDCERLTMRHRAAASAFAWRCPRRAEASPSGSIRRFPFAATRLSRRVALAPDLANDPRLATWRFSLSCAMPSSTRR